MGWISSIKDAGSMQKILIVITEPVYGSENPYNALRLAKALLEKENVRLSIYLLGDAVVGARKGQQTPKGFYNFGKMLMIFANKGVPISLCITCMEARGIKEEDLVEGVKMGGMQVLSEWVLTHDKVLTF
jgi:uncharacterized protein involved in oxidation of intracellular sulfur